MTIIRVKSFPSGRCVGPASPWGNVVNLRILQGAVRYFSVGAATSRPKRYESEQMVERIPPDGSQKSLLLLEKVPAAAGECGGDTY